MFAAVIWGLIQGLTEFLPVSSTAHLVIIPAFLSEMGIDVPVPSLAVLAVLHLGTLAAVLIYYRREVMSVLQLRTNREGRKLALLVGIGTIPALIGLRRTGPRQWCLLSLSPPSGDTPCTTASSTS